MDSDAKALLQVTYLKPLRDAEAEMTPGYRSRLAQILQSHNSFKKEKGVDGQYKKHELEKLLRMQIKKFQNSSMTLKLNHQMKLHQLFSRALTPILRIFAK